VFVQQQLLGKPTHELTLMKFIWQCSSHCTATIHSSSLQQQFANQNCTGEEQLSCGSTIFCASCSNWEAGVQVRHGSLSFANGKFMSREKTRWQDLACQAAETMAPRGASCGLGQTE